MSTLLPETQFLLAACRSALDPEAITEMPRLAAASGFSWKEAHRLAARHRVRPQLLRALGKLPELKIPEDDLEALRLECRQIAFHAMNNAREQIRVLQFLEEQGITAVLYKGPHLAQLAYGGVGQRETTDLDIFIYESALEAVKKVLPILGYRPDLDLDPKGEEIRLRNSYDYNFSYFQDSRLLYHLECHLKPAPRRLRMDLHLEDLDTVPFQLAGITLRAPSPTATLLTIVVNQGGKDRWLELRNLCDLAFFIHHHSASVDWKGLLRQLEVMGLTGIFREGLALSRELLGLRLPHDLKAVTGDLPKLPIAQFATYNDPHPASRLSYLQRFLQLWQYHLRRRDRWRDKAAISWEHLRYLFTPTHNDTLTTSLPPQLYFLLGWVKPFRLLRQHLFPGEGLAD